LASYLDQLIALRDAMVARAIDKAGVSSYSLDGESWTADSAAQLKTLQELILMEQNRVPGRREMRIVRGREAVRLVSMRCADGG
jgi:hypothetical protein